MENSRTVSRNSLRWILEYYLEQSDGILDLMLCKPTAQQSIQQQAGISNSKQQRRKPAAENRAEQPAEEESQSSTICFYSVTFFPGDRKHTVREYCSSEKDPAHYLLMYCNHKRAGLLHY